MNRLNENTTGTKDIKASELRSYWYTVIPHVFLYMQIRVLYNEVMGTEVYCWHKNLYKAHDD